MYMSYQYGQLRKENNELKAKLSNTLDFYDWLCKETENYSMQETNTTSNKHGKNNREWDLPLFIKKRYEGFSYRNK
jgi:hypothetical protein